MITFPLGRELRDDESQRSRRHTTRTSEQDIIAFYYLKWRRNAGSGGRALPESRPNDDHICVWRIQLRPQDTSSTTTSAPPAVGRLRRPRLSADSAPAPQGSLVTPMQAIRARPERWLASSGCQRVRTRDPEYADACSTARADTPMPLLGSRPAGDGS